MMSVRFWVLPMLFSLADLAIIKLIMVVAPNTYLSMDHEILAQILSILTLVVSIIVFSIESVVNGDVCVSTTPAINVAVAAQFQIDPSKFGDVPKVHPGQVTNIIILALIVLSLVVSQAMQYSKRQDTMFKRIYKILRPNRVEPFKAATNPTAGKEQDEQTLQMVKKMGYTVGILLLIALGFFRSTQESSMKKSYLVGKVMFDVLCMYWFIMIDGVYDLARRRILIIVSGILPSRTPVQRSETV